MGERGDELRIGQEVAGHRDDTLGQHFIPRHVLGAGLEAGLDRKFKQDLLRFRIKHGPLDVKEDFAFAGPAHPGHMELHSPDQDANFQRVFIRRVAGLEDRVLLFRHRIAGGSQFLVHMDLELAVDFGAKLFVPFVGAPSLLEYASFNRAKLFAHLEAGPEALEAHGRQPGLVRDGDRRPSGNSLDDDLSRIRAVRIPRFVTGRGHRGAGQPRHDQPATGPTNAS